MLDFVFYMLKQTNIINLTTTEYNKANPKNFR